ncbi:hypothetical protein HOY80DRAFT_1040157 [Tuber brumale]|nr:hypothetical protein HOY80DRAFT_1040157 [Tuber brumale]
MAASRINDNTVRIGGSISDGLHTKGHCTNGFTLRDAENMQEVIRKSTVDTIVAYSISKGICAHIWRHLDIVCALIKAQTTPLGIQTTGETPVDVEELAD